MTSVKKTFHFSLKQLPVNSHTTAGPLHLKSQIKKVQHDFIAYHNHNWPVRWYCFQRRKRWLVTAMFPAASDNSTWRYKEWSAEKVYQPCTQAQPWKIVAIFHVIFHDCERSCEGRPENEASPMPPQSPAV